LNSSFIVTQQIVKCLIYIQKGKFLSFPLYHFFFKFTQNIK
jgi:hypothetical protein